MCDENEKEAMISFMDTFGRGKRANRREFLADDVVVNHWRWGEKTLEGKEVLLSQYYDPLLKSFPDLDFIIKESYMGEDSVVLRGEFNGTFTGEWANCQPHGRPVRWRPHDIYQFKEGKVARIWLGNDTLNVARQLGALPDDGKPW